MDNFNNGGSTFSSGCTNPKIPVGAFDEIGPRYHPNSIYANYTN